MDFDVFDLRKLHVLPFILCYETVHANLLTLKGDGQIYFVTLIIWHIQCVCNHSAEFVVIF
jgi:hypothetical protein